jgi:hypothetical protein
MMSWQGRRIKVRLSKSLGGMLLGFLLTVLTVSSGAQTLHYLPAFPNSLPQIIPSSLQAEAIATVGSTGSRVALLNTLTTRQHALFIANYQYGYGEKYRDHLGEAGTGLSFGNPNMVIHGLIGAGLSRTIGADTLGKNRVLEMQRLDYFAQSGISFLAGTLQWGLVFKTVLTHYFRGDFDVAALSPDELEALLYLQEHPFQIFPLYAVFLSKQQGRFNGRVMVSRLQYSHTRVSVKSSMTLSVGLSYRWNQGQRAIKKGRG